MAITSSTLRIYNDRFKTTLIATITTSSDANPVLAEHLDEGQEYWATIAVAENLGRDSEESPVYQFFTLPDVEFVSPPSAAGTTAYYDVRSVANTVGVARCGVYIEPSNSNLSRPRYIWTYNDTAHGEINDLDQNTIYYITPIVEDEFGRFWKNDAAMVGIITGADAPTITLANIIAYNDSAEGDVTVVSNTHIQSLTIQLRSHTSIVPITATGYLAMAGQQHWTVSGLQPNTEYLVTAVVTTDTGSATASGALVTTDTQADASVDLTAMTLSTQYIFDTADVAAIGTCTNATVDTVGVKFYTVNSHAGQEVLDVHGAEGVASIGTSAEGLPSGYRIYGFAYMDYIVGTAKETVWSNSKSIVTAPRIYFGNNWSFSANTAAGSVITDGNVLTAITVEYREQNGNEWTAVQVYNGQFTITGLQPNTTYEVRATATNESGSGYDYYTFTTNNAVVKVTAVNATNVTATSAVVKINVITE